MSKESGNAITPELERLLKERAQKLASSGAARADEKASAEGKYFLIFYIGPDKCALPLEDAKEAIALTSIIDVPNAPAHVAGIIRLRGTVEALVDLRRFWQKSVVGHFDSDAAIIVEKNGVSFGILCSAIEGLAFFQKTEISPVPPDAPSWLAPSLDGIAGKDAMIISVEKLLSQRGFVVRQGL